MSITPKSAPAKVTAAPKTLSAKPGTKDQSAKGKGKKEKVVRVDYPGLFGEDTGDGPERLKLTAIPEDYNSKIHKPLKRSDFVDESVFLISKAERLEKLAAKLRKEAETVKSLGTTAQRQSAKKLLKMQESMATLMASLAEQGVDVQSLLATVQTAKAPADEVATTEAAE